MEMGPAYCLAADWLLLAAAAGTVRNIWLSPQPLAVPQ